MRTTLMQWRAYEACAIEGLTQAQAADRFGVTRQAIGQRIRRYLRRSGNIFARGRRRLIRTISLSSLTDV